MSIKTISLEECSRQDYNIRFLEAIGMPQRVTNPPFSSIGHPKRQDMLLYVDGCRTRYLTKDGRRITTSDMDVVYVPVGSEYRVECIGDSDRAKTLQINLLFFDADFSQFRLADDVTVLKRAAGHLRESFEGAVLLSKNASTSPAEKKVLLFELLTSLLKGDDTEGLGVIGDGVEYLRAHYCDDPPIGALAEVCHLSEEYFRRIFKRKLGSSPVEYKNALRLKKAEQYLQYTDMSVVEISESLSYSTVSHFIKCFKDNTGFSPLAYRNGKKG